MWSRLLLNVVVLCMAINTFTVAIDDDSVIRDNAASDLQTSATSSKLLNLGGLFGTGNGVRYPNRPGYGYYPNSGYPSSGYPSYGYSSSGYPSYGSSSYGGYGSSGYPSYGGYGSSGYPTSGYPYNSYNSNAGYYPNTAGTYPYSSWNAGGGNYYPNSGSGYYPSSGTNILGGGNGGYGGYGGNGGLRQYSGYWNRSYEGQRNLGYGYYRDTDRYGLPKNRKNDSYSSPYGSRDRDRIAQPYRGYD